MSGRVFTNDLVTKQKRDVLCAIILIKEKRCRKFKIRACIYGRSQRSYITKKEYSTPMLSMDLLLDQLIVDAFEECAMAIFDVPNAYLNSYMPEDKFVLLKLEDEFMDIM